MSSFALLSILTGILKSELEDQGIQLSPYCGEQVEHMISIGVERMTMAKVIEKQDKVHLAEENIKRLIEYLSDQAKAYGSFPYLEDLAFDMAIGECYPLWPYI